MSLRVRLYVYVHIYVSCLPNLPKSIWDAEVVQSWGQFVVEEQFGSSVVGDRNKRWTSVPNQRSLHSSTARCDILQHYNGEFKHDV